MNDLLIDHISYSQLTQAQECPYAYYLLKIDGVKPLPNAFAQAGTLVHQLLSMWARGEVAIGDLPALWAERFPTEVTEPLPPYLESKGYRSKLFDSILTYFGEFDGFPDYDIVAAEKEFTSCIGGMPFVGIMADCCRCIGAFAEPEELCSAQNAGDAWVCQHWY